MKRTQKKSGRFMTGILGSIIFVCLSIPSGALADIKVSRAINDSDGDGIVESINFTDQTILVAGVKIRITEQTKLFDHEGNPIRLRDMRSGKTSRNPDRVQYWIRKSGGSGVPDVIRLELLGPIEG